MRRFSVLFFLLLSGLISSVHAQGTSVISQTFLQSYGEGDTAYLIATLPASSNSTYDHLHLVATLDCSYYSACDSTLDMTLGNRSGFNVVYTAKGGNPVGLTTHIVAYQQGAAGSAVNVYIVLPNNWVTATYAILENIEETVPSSPSAINIDSNPLTGTLIFDTNSASYPPQNYTDFLGDFLPSGKVGIGTTSPVAPLSVGSSSQFQVSSAGAVSAPSLSLGTALPVASGGTGAAALTGLVKGNGSSAFTPAVAGTDYQAPIALTTTGTGAATLSSNVLNIPQSANTSIANTWTGAQTFGSTVNFAGNGIWNSAGSVGIGTTLPSVPLEVNGSIKMDSGSLTFPDGSSLSSAKSSQNGTYTISSATNAIVTIQSTAAANAGFGANLLLDTSARNWQFGVWNTGNGGILPGSLGIVDNTSGLVRQLFDPSGDVYIGVKEGDGGVNTASLTTLANGNVGVGTTSPAAPLSVGSSSQFQVSSAGAVSAPSLSLGTALPVASGGTGAAALTGLVKGNGSSAFTAAVAGSDYQAPISLTTTGTGAPTLSGNVLNIPQIAPTTFSTGLTNASGTVTANLSTGITGGQTAYGGTGATDVLTLQGTKGSGTLTSPAINLAVGNAGATTALTVLNNGNVGLGATAPQSPLAVLPTSDGSVPGNSVDKVAYFDDGGSHIAGLAKVNGTMGGLFGRGNAGIGIYVNPTYSHNSTTDKAALFATTSGNVGVGTTSPASLFSVGSSSQFQVSSTGVVSAPSLALTTALPVASGGTGSATLTGLVKGNGSSAFTAAVAGSDYQAPISLTTTGTGAPTLSGNVLNIPQNSQAVSSSSGILNAIPKFSGSTTIVPSAITDTNGTVSMSEPVLVNSGSVNSGTSSLTVYGLQQSGIGVSLNIDNGTQFPESASTSNVLFSSGARPNGFAMIQSAGTDYSGGNGFLGFQTSIGGTLAERMRLSSAGYLGIGTTSPASLLSVGSSSQFQVGSTGAVTAPSVTVSGPVAATTFSGSGAGLTGIPYSAITGSPAGGVTSVFGRTGVVTATTGDYTVSQITGAAPLANPVFSGNVGIGTTNPVASLSVQTSSQAPSTSGNATDGMLISAGPSGASLNLGIEDVGVSGQQYGWLQTAYTNSAQSYGYLSFNPLGGNVGIGTTNPAQLLQVGANYAQNPAIMIGGHDNNNASQGTYSLLFGAWRDIETVTSGIVATPVWTCCGGYPTSGSGSYAGIRSNSLGFYTMYDPGSPSNYSPNMFISSSGSVGIGTTMPQAMLDVGGSVRISGSGASLTFPDGTTQSTAYSGTCTATGGDYAESVDVAGDKSAYEPGDIMVIDPSDPHRFLLSSEPYSRLVAGIYSTKPGYVGRRQKGDPKLAAEIPMAMVGIVPTKVTAENGPIGAGDLLVTSSRAGYAMKGTDSSKVMGAVVGKAMGSLASGTGVIEVLVSLQ